MSRFESNAAAATAALGGGTNRHSLYGQRDTHNHSQHSPLHPQPQPQPPSNQQQQQQQPLPMLQQQPQHPHQEASSKYIPSFLSFHSLPPSSPSLLRLPPTTTTTAPTPTATATAATNNSFRQLPSTQPQSQTPMADWNSSTATFTNSPERSFSNSFTSTLPRPLSSPSNNIPLTPSNNTPPLSNYLYQPHYSLTSANDYGLESDYPSHHYASSPTPGSPRSYASPRLGSLRSNGALTPTMKDADLLTDLPPTNSLFDDVSTTCADSILMNIDSQHPSQSSHFIYSPAQTHSPLPNRFYSPQATSHILSPQPESVRNSIHREEPAVHAVRVVGFPPHTSALVQSHFKSFVVGPDADKLQCLYTPGTNNMIIIYPNYESKQRALIEGDGQVVGDNGDLISVSSLNASQLPSLDVGKSLIDNKYSKSTAVEQQTGSGYDEQGLLKTSQNAFRPAAYHPYLRSQSPSHAKVGSPSRLNGSNYRAGPAASPDGFRRVQSGSVFRGQVNTKPKAPSGHVGSDASGSGLRPASLVSQVLNAVFGW